MSALCTVLKKGRAYNLDVILTSINKSLIKRLIENIIYLYIKPNPFSDQTT